MKQTITILSGFFFLLLSVEAWAMEQDTPLVQIYCDTVIQRAHSGVDDGLNATSSGSETDSWQGLIQRLESREPIPEAKVLDPARYEQCLQENREEFQEGEFILDGKRLLDETLQPSRKWTSNNAVPESRLPREAAQVDLAGLGSFNFDLSNQASSASPSGSSDELQRKAHYQELWRAFLLRVRGNFAPHRASAQLSR